MKQSKSKLTPRQRSLIREELLRVRGEFKKAIDQLAPCPTDNQLQVRYKAATRHGNRGVVKVLNMLVWRYSTWEERGRKREGADGGYVS